MAADDDRLLEIFAGLSPIASDVEWEIRVRKRCHAALSRRASRHARTRRGLSSAGLIDVAMATALCFYLAAVVAAAIHLVSNV